MLNFFSFFMYFFYNRDIIFWWLLMPMPTITMFKIASVLPTSRLWCNWLFFLMNLPFDGPFTAILNPIEPPFHLLPWSSKDEKTLSRIWVQENKITNKQRHICINKHTIYLMNNHTYMIQGCIIQQLLTTQTSNDIKATLGVLLLLGILDTTTSHYSSH